MVDTRHRVRFSPQNEEFKDTQFTGHITKITFDKLGNMVVQVIIGWEWKQELLPNLSYASNMPLHFEVKPFDGREHSRTPDSSDSESNPIS